jgi:hypothetical protein
VGEYVQNRLPMRLLKLDDMNLLHRFQIEEEIHTKISAGGYFCKEEECGCLETIKDELKYSILSHRWGRDEFTYNHLMMLDGPPPKKTKTSESEEEKPQTIAQGIEKLLGNPTALDNTPLEKLKELSDLTRSASVRKLLNFREQSIERECEYGWVDTVCINKVSSAELDESLRSMYAWYRDSHVCIVWLSETEHFSQLSSDPWFTRGWTLQELLAPKRIAFFAKGWDQISKHDNTKLKDKKKEMESYGPKSLWPTISKITGIPIEDLLDFKPGPCDIAKRLGWASKRKTTKIEDVAYCLIGIFDVTLPIAYGEQERAFYRLQAELMQASNDKSVFTWQGEASQWNSMMAARPQCFSTVLPPLIDVLPLVDSDPLLSMSNIGLRMPALIWKTGENGVPKVPETPKATHMAVIGKLSDSGNHFIVLLTKTEVPRQYRRVGMTKSSHIAEDKVSKKKVELIYIK